MELSPKCPEAKREVSDVFDGLFRVAANAAGEDDKMQRVFIRLRTKLIEFLDLSADQFPSWTENGTSEKVWNCTAFKDALAALGHAICRLNRIRAEKEPFETKTAVCALLEESCDRLCSFRPRLVAPTRDPFDITIRSMTMTYPCVLFPGLPKKAVVVIAADSEMSLIRQGASRVNRACNLVSAAHPIRALREVEICLANEGGVTKHVVTCELNMDKELANFAANAKLEGQFVLAPTLNALLEADKNAIVLCTVLFAAAPADADEVFATLCALRVRFAWVAVSFVQVGHVPSAPLFARAARQIHPDIVDFYPAEG